MFKLLLMFLAYVIITALPLLTLNIYSLDASFLIMVSTEFSLAIIAYFFYFRNYPGFSLRIRSSQNILHIFMFHAIIVVALQLLAFFIVQHNTPSAPTRFPVLLIIILTIIVPIYEEFFFRGCLLGGLNLIFKKNITTGVITSIVFCAMHTQYNELFYFLFLFISSLLMAHMRLRTNGLIYPIALHSI
ncbi:TPA: CPBP family intramembrane metalloprotease, partial [Enterobacter hormaechei subsp. steigerwaltii]|nr:CPBP family intramembrane metalloprotease [Enterobacter hormaechei subsp. steigerwaltii]